VPSGYPVGGPIDRGFPIPARTPTPVGAGQGGYVVGGNVVNRPSAPLPPPRLPIGRRFVR
jgi:hypothetical protein